MKLLCVALWMAGAVWADESITALGRRWSVPLAADWRGTEGTLELLVKRPQEKPRRPKQFALLEEGPYAAVTVEVEVKRNETSLILVYAYQDDAHFNYVHLSVDDPAKAPVHNGVFHVFGGGPGADLLVGGRGGGVAGSRVDASEVGMGWNDGRSGLLGEREDDGGVARGGLIVAEGADWIGVVLRVGELPESASYRAVVIAL